MPKAIYGHKKKSSRGKATDAADDTHGWLTLMTIPLDGQDKFIDMVEAAISSAVATELLEPGMAASLAASLVEYNATRNADCDEAWLSLLTELFEDAGVPLAAAAEAGDDAANVEHNAGAADLLAALRKAKVLRCEPPPPPPLEVGSPVLAVLEEDGEWHEACVEKVTKVDGEPPRVTVRFTQWSGKLQEEMARSRVIQLVEVADDEDAESVGEGECALCERSLPLTFHHLLPKQTHHRYLGRECLPTGVTEAATALGLTAEPTREFLHRYGTMLCRFCHSTVHQLAPNAVLAERFNTIDVLRSTPAIAQFASFAARQTARRQR